MGVKMFYSTWHNLRPDGRKEEKLYKLGYLGMTACGISPYQERKINNYIKNCIYDVVNSKEWFEDTDIEYTNNCFGWWFESDNEKIGLEQLLNSFPKREHYFEFNEEHIKNVNSYFNKVKKSQDCMIYYGKQDYVYDIINGSNKIIDYCCLSTSNPTIATYFKLRFQ